jgi:hypothetical protein
MGAGGYLPLSCSPPRRGSAYLEVCGDHGWKGRAVSQGLPLVPTQTHADLSPLHLQLLFSRLLLVLSSLYICLNTGKRLLYSEQVDFKCSLRLCPRDSSFLGISYPEYLFHSLLFGSVPQYVKPQPSSPDLPLHSATHLFNQKSEPRA